jgi:hypothetical protein
MAGIDLSTNDDAVERRLQLGVTKHCFSFGEICLGNRCPRLGGL